MTRYTIKVRYPVTTSCRERADSLDAAIAKVRLLFRNAEVVYAVDESGAELTDEAKRIWEKA